MNIEKYGLWLRQGQGSHLKRARGAHGVVELDGNFDADLVRGRRILTPAPKPAGCSRDSASGQEKQKRPDRAGVDRDTLIYWFLFPARHA